MPVEVVEEHRVLVDRETRRVPAHDALLGRGACVQLIHGSMELHIDSNLRQEYESVWVSQAREREIASDRDIIRGVKIARDRERDRDLLALAVGHREAGSNLDDALGGGETEQGTDDSLAVLALACVVIEDRHDDHRMDVARGRSALAQEQLRRHYERGRERERDG